MTREEAQKILAEYVKACREDDMFTLEQFVYEEVIEAMSMGAEALSVCPVYSNLEEAARRYLLNEHSSPLNAIFHQADIKSEMVYHKDIENAFVAGGIWQKEQDEKEQADLFTIVALDAAQRAREQILKDGNVILTEEDFDAEKEKSMDRGYNLCKEQMLKEAVEGEVVKDINNKLAVTAKNVNLDKFKFGDKVRIIIVKELLRPKLTEKERERSATRSQSLKTRCVMMHITKI